MYVLPFFSIVTGEVKALNFHVIEKSRAVGILGDIAGGPKVLVHGVAPEQDEVPIRGKWIQSQAHI
jgi:hypothetical protein